MKKLITILFILLTLPIYAQWVQQISGTSENLNDVYCITENFVVAVGDNGTILKTTDGGTTWVQKTSGTTNNLTKVQFPSPLVGYTIEANSSIANGILLKTIDGGENWTALPYFFGASQNFYTQYGLSCISENIFYITDSGSIKKTIDGGVTFTTLNTPSDQFIENIQFLNEQVGYASNIQNIIKTIDGGNTWSIIDNNPTSFFFFNENIGFVNNLDGLYKTIDGGNTYTFLNALDCNMNKLFATTTDVFWGTPVECILNGSPCYSIRGEILGTGQFQVENDIPFKSFHFASPTKGYAVGSNEIYKNATGNLGINRVEKKGIITIYPNPAKDHLNLTFNNSVFGSFELEIKDGLGKIIFCKSYHDENSVTLDTSSFSKGIYFLSVLSKQINETQKLIIN